jgi:hypothetical protein
MSRRWSSPPSPSIRQVRLQARDLNELCAAAAAGRSTGTLRVSAPGKPWLKASKARCRGLLSAADTGYADAPSEDRVRELSRGESMPEEC